MFKKKKNTIMLIFTMLTSFVLLFSMNTSYGTGITGSDTINGKKLKKGETIELSADVVYQKNVLCAQHGTKIKSGSAYAISDEYIVEDPVLAYILTQGHEASQVKSGYWISDTQIALWMYLYNSKSDEAETITKGISCDKVVKDSKTMYTEDYNKGVDLYNKAVAYGKSKNNVSVKIKNFSTESGKVTFTVTGSYDGFTVKFNSVEIGTYKTSDEKNITIDPEGATEANVEVTAYKDIEKITYRILKGTKTQRLLVVTSSGGTTTGPKAETIKNADLSTDVSLQKYIVATGSVFESNQLKEVSNKLDTKRMDWKASEENGEAIQEEREGNKGIKNDNPVSISKGDYVIYRISVYDNEYKIGKGNITVQLKDRINVKYGELKGIYKELDSSELKLSEKIDGEHYLSSEDKDYNYYRWNYEFKEKDSCYVVVQYNKEFTSSLISNKAFINTNNESQYRTVDYDFVAMTTDVSLQKYITAVGKTFNINDKTGTLSDNTYGYNMSNRNLRMATSDSNNKIYSEYNSAYKKNGNKNIASDKYKYDDPIEISKGDYVIYKIEVYNNKKAKATVTVKDRISKYGTLIGIFDTHPTKDDQLTFEGRLNDLDKEDYYYENKHCYYYRWSATVEGNSSNAYWVVVKYDNAKEDTIIDNRALIDDNFNESEYCTKDFDYIILKSYAVSLKKYVSKVTDKNGDNSLSYDSRLDTRFNAYAEDTLNKSNYNEYKKNNPVSVELGDIVTYTIRLKNEGSAPIIIKEIYDYYDSGALTYNNSISQGTWSSVESGSLNERKDGKTLSNMSCAKISFGDGITLDKGATENVNITFKVEKEKDSAYNIAQVKEIFDGDVAVNDSDGEDNNTDEDWIKFKTYAVSLEKYVYQVDGNNVDSREGKAEYLTYKDGKYVDETTKDTEYTEHNQYKYNKAVETSNGYTVTYRIKVKNDGESSVYISEIKDYLPLGVRYEGIEYGAVAYDGTIDSSKAISLNKLSDTLIEPGKNKDILISVYVTEPNSSINVLKNIAEITEIKNRNGIEVNDTTPNNNRDADYIVLNTGTSSDKVDYNVEKVWDDGDGTGRPKEIMVQLYQNDSKYGTPAIVSKDCDKPWKYTWRDLPKYDSDGKLYTYKAIEEVVVPSGYKVSYEYGDNLAVITNKKETITKKVEKVWADGEGNTIDAPEKVSINVQLLQNGEVKETIELPGTTGWTHTWEGLPKYDESGSEYIYTIEETAVTINEENVIANYKTDISTSGETTIIKNIQIDSETVSKTVKKVWADEDGNTIDAPEKVSINVKLLQNGEVKETIELPGTTGWTHTWEGLAKYDKDGKLIKYDIIEDSVSGYTPVYKVDGDITTITNKRGNTGEPISKTVKKVWLDSSGNTVTPAEGTKIQVQLSKDGTPMTDTKYTVELNSSNNWKCTWTDLENGHLYTVEEISVTVGESNVLGNYNITYSNDGEEIIVTNQEKTINEKVSKTVKKVWLDSSGNAIPDTSSLSGITVQLYRNGKPMGDDYKVTLNNDVNWTHTWSELDKYDSSRKEYQYEVREDEVPEGYTVNYSINGDEIIVTNKKNNTGEKVSKTVKKVWLDSSGNAIPDTSSLSGITVQLYRNGESMGDDYKKTLSSSNNWTDTWDLDKYDSAGNEYQYTVIEVDVPEGYTAIYKDDGFTIQNKKIEYTNITVKKGWIDDEEPHASIKVQLNKDGTAMTDTEDTKYTVELNSSNNWTYTWVSLPKTGAYTVQEQDVPEGYTSTTMTTESDTEITFIIKNTKTDPDPDPDPEDPSNPPSKPKPVIPTDVVISGYVWNDMALNKTSNSYDGIYNADEKPLTGVGVYLYREDKLDEPITSTSTVLGYYSFGDSSVGDKGIRVFETRAEAEKESKNFIKGKRRVFTWIDENGETRYEISNIWEKYYSYYIVFEYDGITYTSTEYHSFSEKTDLLDSNAKENGDKVSKTRENFNSGFSTINNTDSNISYYTTNKDSYIPQSIHYYNSSMSIQSSTECIEMGGPSATKEIYLKYINLGLRGRDTFDLELTSDVEKVEVTINNQQGVYNYGNKVNLRRNDFTTRDDMANVDKEASNKYVDDQYQNIRSTDIGDKLTKILVTYKITVQNASATAGTATKITNYYDSKYKYVGAYSDSSCSNELSYATGSSGTNYNSVVITTLSTQLNQSDTMEIYVVYSYDLDNYKGNLISLKNGQGLATYNMAEITEYKTFTTTYDNKTNNEATRGLLDKDSAPGSAATEKVRLTTDTDKVRAFTTGSPTTVDYYFKGEKLEQLKYEDDTYATPTLYFVKDGNERTITGTVFEDKTTTNSETKIKTGNGKLDDGEVGVYGATVLLVELVAEDENDGKLNNMEQVKIGDKCYSVRKTATTDQEGKFEFTAFLPGNYIIRYYYGDTDNTVLLNQKGDGVNSKSYNGEDFQATNNGSNADETTKPNPELNTTENYWYVYNEKSGISTANDNGDRRIAISDKVTSYTDEEMTVLNNMRAGKAKDDCKVDENTVDNIINDTYMFADTGKMYFAVEKIINLNDYLNDELKEGEDYKKIDGSENLATWTVYPNEQSTYYKEYKIENMNFGIAEIPVTTVDLQKYVSKFTITDSTGSNIIASGVKENEGEELKWKTTGQVLPVSNNIDISIENEELQGARLEIEYTISLNVETEKNFNNTLQTSAKPTVTSIVDYIDNNLSYNEKLGENEKNWSIATYQDVLTKFKEQKKFDGVTEPTGTVDPTGSKYSTIVMATTANGLLNLIDGHGESTITLEKVLTSVDSSISQIIDDLDTSTFENTVEIASFDYLNVSTSVDGVTETTSESQAGKEIDINGDGIPDAYILRDRVRTADRSIIIPGVQHDTASSETLVIHPPTGDMSIAMIYLLVAILSLGILAGGIFGIKKFVIKK